MGWIAAVALALPFVALALAHRKRLDAVAQRGRDRASLRATELAERLGWASPRVDRPDTTWVLRGELGRTQALVLVPTRGEWVRVELRGRRFLPDGFEVRGAHGSGPDPLERERPNFTTEAGGGLVVTPLERFTSPSSPWGALARATPGGVLPHLTTDTLKACAFSIATTDDAVSFVRSAAEFAEGWVTATKAAQGQATA